MLRSILSSSRIGIYELITIFCINETSKVIINSRTNIAKKIIHYLIKNNLNYYYYILLFLYYLLKKSKLNIYNEL